jgi:outer membrane protein TolC
MLRNKNYIAIFCLIFSCIQLKAQTTSLEEVLEIIKNNNPQLKMIDAEILSMDTLAPGAKSWMNPQISSGLFMTPYKTGLWRPNDMNNGMGSYMIGVSQMIPNPKKQNAEYNYMKAMSSVEKENKNYTLNQLFSLAKFQYYQLVIVLKKTTIAEENLALLEYMIKSMEIKYQYNMDKLSTYYKSKSQYNAQESMIVMLKNTAKQKQILLNTLMAKDKNTALNVDTVYFLKTYDNELFDPSSLFATRSDLRAIDRTIRLNELKIISEKSKNLPEFGVRYDHMFTFGRNPNMFSLMGMITIPMPWSTKMNNANAISVKLKNDALNWQKEMIINETTGILTEMKTELKNLTKQYEISENSIIPALKRNYEVALLSWQNNTGNLFEVLDAWEGLNMAQLDALDKLQNILNTQVELEKQLELK